MGTKIIVLKLKNIIKSFVYVLAGLILIALLIFLFRPKTNSSSSVNNIHANLYNPGNYFSQVMLNNKTIDLKISVDQDKILAIDLDGLNSAQEVFYPLIKPTLEILSREIIQAQSTQNLISQDSSITEKILLNAIDNALAQAKIN